MSELVCLDRTGDTKIIWDKNSPAEVEVARAAFNRLKGEKKYLAYAVKDKGEKGKVITEFDPNEEKIILAPPMVGG